MPIVLLTEELLEPACCVHRTDGEAFLSRLRWCLHTDYADALCLMHEHGDVQGVACAVRFGATAWVLDVQVDPYPKQMERWRAELMAALLAHLEAQGCTTINLVATLEDVPRWEAVGFVPREQLLRYSEGKFFQATHDEVVIFEPQYRMGALHLDRKASGEERGEWIIEHAYLGQVYVEGNKVRGFTLALMADGLIIADSPIIGLELQRWQFPIQEHMLIPEGNTAAHTHLLERGYTATPVGVRMEHGAPLNRHVEMCFGWPWGPV